jgi:hypothetical protein
MNLSWRRLVGRRERGCAAAVLAGVGGWFVLAAAAAPGSVVDSATGSGGVTGGAGGKVTFSFTARDYGTGADEGQIEAKNHLSGRREHVEVDCLRVVGNIAVMSGTLKHTDPSAPVQEGFSIFAVQDNGEGANDPPDRVSNLFSRSFAPFNCETQMPLGGITFEVERGNIQVRDG